MNPLPKKENSNPISMGSSFGSS